MTPAPASGITLGCLVAVVAAAATLVGVFDAVLRARVDAGTDTALRLSVILPYLGVDGTYVLARALGLAALVLAALSVGLGLETARRRQLGMPVPAPLPSLHRQLSLTTLALVAAHATAPYLSAVPPYGGWPTALVPFAQPFSWGTQATVAESLGILAFYLLLLVGPSYYLLRRRHGLWSLAHRLALVAYALVVLHVLLLGSDFSVAGGVRVALVALQVPLVVLLARRIWASRRSSLHVAAARAATVAALVVAVALAAVAAFGAAGATLGGIRL